MKILITGGTGLIGSHFIKTFQHQYQFDVLTRSPESLGYIFNDLTNINGIAKLYPLTNLNEYDAVINLAGEPIVNKRWNQTQKRIICQSRWKLTNKLSKLINDSENPPHTFISGSAIGFYGRQGDENISENHTDIYPEFSHRICKVWEDKAKLSKDKTRLCILRTGIVLDKNQGALAKMLPAYRYGLGGKLSLGKQYMSWIHINDMVGAIDFILNNKQCVGEFNLTAPNPVTNKVFSKSLAKTLNKPNIFTVPAVVLRFLMGESADIILYGQRVVPKQLIEHKFNFQFPELNNALKHLLEKQ